MKTLKNKLKSISFLFALVMIIQSCTVYKSKPISLDQAVQKESKVRVQTNDNEKLKFKKIIFENSNYYGVKKSKGELVRIPLNQEFIFNIKEKNKTLSTVLSIGIPLVIVGGLLVIAASSMSMGSFTFTFPPGYYF